jgi:hypothetical protein
MVTGREDPNLMSAFSMSLFRGNNKKFRRIQASFWKRGHAGENAGTAFLSPAYRVESLICPVLRQLHIGVHRRVSPQIGIPVQTAMVSPRYRQILQQIRTKFEPPPSQGQSSENQYVSDLNPLEMNKVVGL